MNYCVWKTSEHGIFSGNINSGWCYGKFESVEEAWNHYEEIREEDEDWGVFACKFGNGFSTDREGFGCINGEAVKKIKGNFFTLDKSTLKFTPIK